MSVVQLSERRAMAGGFYTVHEAARVLRIENESKIRRWLSGGPGGTRPVIRRQYQPVGEHQELGFLDLMEVRFIDYFRKQNISLQSIRKAAEAARIELDHDHPFALFDAKFVTDRKRIFLQTATETGDTLLRDIVSGQFAFYDFIEQFLAKGVEFDAATGVAEQWWPAKETYPNIVLNPLRAHGQPVIEPANLPTETLYALWRAEGQDFDVVADWYEVSRDLVEQAIYFEIELAA